jgi:hypothetical protein
MNIATHGHRLQPIGARSLHPTEALLVSMATARGAWVRTCTCGLMLLGNNEVDVYCRWKQHRDTAARLAAERGLG